jgi:hypothetical protein
MSIYIYIQFDTQSIPGAKANTHPTLDITFTPSKWKQCYVYSHILRSLPLLMSSHDLCMSRLMITLSLWFTMDFKSPSVGERGDSQILGPDPSIASSLTLLSTLWKDMSQAKQHNLKFCFVLSIDKYICITKLTLFIIYMW